MILHSENFARSFIIELAYDLVGIFATLFRRDVPAKRIIFLADRLDEFNHLRTIVNQDESLIPCFWLLHSGKMSKSDIPNVDHGNAIISDL